MDGINHNKYYTWPSYASGIFKTYQAALIKVMNKGTNYTGIRQLKYSLREHPMIPSTLYDLPA